MELESIGNIHINNIPYVLGLKKSLLFIYLLEGKGDRVAFFDEKFIVWAKGSSIENARTIGIHEGRLYRLLTPPPQALVHLDINSCELWHRRYGHLYYKIFPSMNQIITSMP